MRFKKAARAIGVTMLAGAAGLGVVQSASAAPHTVNPYTRYSVTSFGVVGQLDTSPGDGAPSWVWGYGQNNAGYVEYEYYDGAIKSLYVPSGGSSTIEPSQLVWRIRTCNTSWQCGSWTG